MPVRCSCCRPQPRSCWAAKNGVSDRARSHSSRPRPAGPTARSSTTYWSVAGDNDRGDIGNRSCTRFLSKQFPGGRTLSFNFESSYDWKGENWTVPLNLGYSKVTHWGKHMLSWQGGVRYYLETSGDGPESGLRAAVTLLFPEQ